MSARSQAEILARFRAADDMFGFARQVLAEAMTRETLIQAIPDIELPDDWAPVENLETPAREYLDFAIGKIEDHRGISASRSVDKLREYAWLMGRDDVVSAMDDEDYTQYGAPKVKAFASVLGWPWPDDNPAMERMANGIECTDFCEMGCA